MAGESRSEDVYIPNYEFEIQLGLVIKINFSKISNISSQREYEVVADGGNNDRMYFREKAKRKPDTIAFHKGLAIGVSAAILSWLVEGLKVNDIMILVKREGKTEKIFYIEQGILTKVSFSDLDALNGKIIIKTMEMQHTGVVEISV